MKIFKQTLLVLTLFFCLTPLFAQQYGTGALIDPVKYQQTDAKPALVSRDYTSIPRSSTLKQYSPFPESQGQYGTCTGWSTAFAARTISESIALGRTNRAETTANVFSPLFVYKSISGDPSGQTGTAIPDALDLMKNQGAVKRPAAERTLDFMNVVLSLFANFRRYPISGYVRLFSSSASKTNDEKVAPVKKSLAEGKPVVIAMYCPLSFFSAAGVWQPYENPNQIQGAHAMCVVGYDDDMYGGAFEVQNSWGSDWGNDGYIWISYRDFVSYVAEAYEIIENLAVYKDAARYAASIEIEVANNTGGMPVIFDRQGFYRTRAAYLSGTRFRYLMTNQYPAYVYSFAADSSTPGTTRIFPLRGTSPVLDYMNSTIAWPGEYDWIQLNNVTGTDYLVVLYAKEALDIDAIEQRFAAASGTFAERAARAVGNNFIPYSRADYGGDTMRFSAVSANPKAVFGLLLAIDHK